MLKKVVLHKKEDEEDKIIGQIFLDKDRSIKIEAESDEEKSMIQEVVNEIVEKGIEVRQGHSEVDKEGKRTCVMTLVTIDKKDPFYLDGLEEALRDIGFSTEITEDEIVGKLKERLNASVIDQIVKDDIIKYLDFFTIEQVKEIMVALDEGKDQADQIQKQIDELTKQ